MEWLRLYSEILNDSKIMLLPETYRWRYVALLCVVSESKQRGTIPSDEEVIFKLRISEDEWASTLNTFITRGLVEKTDGTCTIHAWDKRQYSSDDSAKRVQKHRYNAVTRPLQDRYSNGRVTPPDTDTDTDTEGEQTQTAAPTEAEKPLTVTELAIVPLFSQIAAVFNEADLKPTRNRLHILHKAINNKNIGGFKRIMEAATNLARAPGKEVIQRYDWLLHKFEHEERITEWLTAKNNAAPKPRKYAEVPDDWRPHASAATTT